MRESSLITVRELCRNCFDLHAESTVCMTSSLCYKECDPWQDRVCHDPRLKSCSFFATNHTKMSITPHRHNIKFLSIKIESIIGPYRTSNIFALFRLQSTLTSIWSVKQDRLITEATRCVCGCLCIFSALCPLTLSEK